MQKRKVQKSKQNFEVELLRTFWLSYILAGIAVVLSYIFSLGASQIALVILGFTILIGIGIFVGIAVAPQKLKNLSKIVALTNMCLALVSFLYLLNWHPANDIRIYHLQFFGICLIYPLLYFHLFTAFKDKIGSRLTFGFYAISLIFGISFLMGLSPNSNDVFLRSA